MKRLFALLIVSAVVFAHPMGNFSVNHYSKLQVGSRGVELRYVLDLAEIPTFELLRNWKMDRSASRGEIDLHANEQAREWLEHLEMRANGRRVRGRLESVRATIADGAGNLPILRLDMRVHFDTAGGVLEYEDRNYPERAGWKEMVVVGSSGATIARASQSGKDLSAALTKYPPDPTVAPPQVLRARVEWKIKPPPPMAVAEREVTKAAPTPEAAVSSPPVSVTAQSAPAGTVVRGDLMSRLLHRSELSFSILLIGLAVAFGLGTFHALTPGHGKAVVAAYLVGSRGTPTHAVFLGLMVTVTHTAGVFALGLLTLFASHYILPESVFPWLSLVSGALVALLGFTLLIQRLSAALGMEEAHGHGHTHFPGGRPHSHALPGAGGEPVSWRSLVALGISGGLLPCPSALVVLLSAIGLHRVGYGLLLVVAFSIGLAATLTAIGLAFVYAGRWLARFTALPQAAQLRRFLPVFSALVVACLGVAISYGAALQAGFQPKLLITRLLTQWGTLSSGHVSLSSMGVLAILGFGLILGFKHATEADHVVAVSSIVSEHRKISKVAIIGALWGAGHTLTLVLVGCVVLLLRITIPEHIANGLEFGVALMIIGLSSSALARALRGRREAPVTLNHERTLTQSHEPRQWLSNREPGNHEQSDWSPRPGDCMTSRISRVGLKPLLVGGMHGLAGSAALTLLVLTQVSSVTLGLGYLLIFGAGSILGMMMVSVVIGLPFALSARHLAGATLRLQAIAGTVGVGFGCWYAFNTGAAFF